MQRREVRIHVRNQSSQNVFQIEGLSPEFGSFVRGGALEPGVANTQSYRLGHQSKFPERVLARGEREAYLVQLCESTVVRYTIGNRLWQRSGSREPESIEP